jgi:hypothetical protein
MQKTFNGSSLFSVEWANVIFNPPADHHGTVEVRAWLSQHHPRGWIQPLTGVVAIMRSLKRQKVGDRYNGALKIITYPH